MENQVLSIEQMLELEELGIDTTKASCIWEYKGSSEGKDFYNLEILDYDSCLVDSKDVPTFTLYDILRLLPKILVFKDDHESNLILGDNALVYYETVTQMFCLEKRGKNILEAAFNMLKWCKQNNYI